MPLTSELFDEAASFHELNISKVAHTHTCFFEVLINNWLSTFLDRFAMGASVERGLGASAARLHERGRLSRVLALQLAASRRQALQSVGADRAQLHGCRSPEHCGRLGDDATRRQPRLRGQASGRDAQRERLSAPQRGEMRTPVRPQQQRPSLSALHQRGVRRLADRRRLARIRAHTLARRSRRLPFDAARARAALQRH